MKLPERLCKIAANNTIVANMKIIDMNVANIMMMMIGMSAANIMMMTVLSIAAVHHV